MKVGSCAAAFTLAVLCLTHCAAQSKGHRPDRSSGEPPRSWAIAKWLRFEGYRVALSPGWVGQSRGLSLFLQPVAEPGVLLEFRRISEKPLPIDEFERSRLAARWVRGLPLPPDRGTTESAHAPFLLYQHRSEPDKRGRIHERGAFVVFFPRSVLLVRMLVNMNLCTLSGQLGHETKLIVERTLEERGPRRARGYSNLAFGPRLGEEQGGKG